MQFLIGFVVGMFIGAPIGIFIIALVSVENNGKDEKESL